MSHDLVHAVLAGDLRAVARLITRLENGMVTAEDDLRHLFSHTGRAHVIGVTGAPGVGKSTVVDALVAQIRGAGTRCAVLAVDPSSPFSGGALLGDRVRMQQHGTDNGVYIRSMSARGATGGLARAVHAAVHVVDAAGFEVVLVETVGVGQSEIAVATATDTTVLLMSPDLGDGIQTLKAGILEVADVVVLNKADQPGAAQALHDLRAALPREASVPVLRAVARDGQGIGELWHHLQMHFQRITTSGMLLRRREVRLQQELRAAIEAAVQTTVLQPILSSAAYRVAQSQVLQRQRDPLSAAHALLPDHTGMPAACAGPG
jgi:LAO/AO transport system kinase